MRTYKVAPGTLMNLAQLQQKITAGYEQAGNNVLTLLAQTGRNSPVGDELVKLHRAIEFERSQSDRHIGDLRNGNLPKSGLHFGFPDNDDLVRALIRPGSDAMTKPARYDQALATQTGRLLDAMAARGQALHMMYHKLDSVAPVYRGSQRRAVQMKTRKTTAGHLSNLMRTIVLQIDMFQRLYSNAVYASDNASSRHLAESNEIVNALKDRAMAILAQIHNGQLTPSLATKVWELEATMLSLVLRVNAAYRKVGAHSNLPTISHQGQAIATNLSRIADRIQTNPKSAKTVSGDLAQLMRPLVQQVGVFASQYESLASADTEAGKYLAAGLSGVRNYGDRAQSILQRIQASDWRGSTATYAQDLANDILGKARMLSIAYRRPGAHGNIVNASNLAHSLFGRLWQIKGMLEVQREKAHAVAMDKLAQDRRRP